MDSQRAWVENVIFYEIMNSPNYELAYDHYFPESFRASPGALVYDTARPKGRACSASIPAGGTEWTAYIALPIGFQHGSARRLPGASW